MSRVRIPSLAPFFSRVFSTTPCFASLLHHLGGGRGLKPRCFDLYFCLVPFGAELEYLSRPSEKRNARCQCSMCLETARSGTKKTIIFASKTLRFEALSFTVENSTASRYGAATSTAYAVLLRS